MTCGVFLGKKVGVHHLQRPVTLFSTTENCVSKYRQGRDIISTALSFTDYDLNRCLSHR